MSNDQYTKLLELFNLLESKFDEKLDAIADHLLEVNVKLAAYNEQLANHIKRTELLEKRIEPLEDSYKSLKGFKFWLFLIGGACAGIASFIYMVTLILKHWGLYG